MTEGRSLKSKRILFDLFLVFFRIGLFTFGGGYPMIAMMEQICVEKKKWITHDEMMNITVIAESTPGPISVNCATFVGYRQAGFAGSCISSLSLVLPPFCVIYLISMFLDNFLEITVIANAFKGIKIAVAILILNAAITMIKKMPKQILPCIIATCSFAAMLLINIFSWNFSSISLMLIAAVFSLILCFAGRNGPKQKGGADDDLS